DLVENGGDTGFRHAGLELEYYATVDVHGNTQITATGTVKLSSTIDVRATAKAAAGADRGDFSTGTAYTKGDLVKDIDGKKYAATKDVAASSTHPKDDTGLLGKWTEAKD